MREGTKNSEKVDQAVGRGPKKPLPEAGLEAKFKECCSVVLGTEAVARLHELCRNLERLDRASELTDAMASAPASPSRAIA